MEGPEGTWWGQKIAAGQTVMLDFRLNSTLVITNACLGEFDASITEPVKLTASVKTLNFDNDDVVSEEEQQVECDYYEQNVTICNLVPNVCERADVSFCFTFMNSIEVTNHGKADVFLSGRLEELDLEDEYDSFLLEEEEEEEEEANEETKKE